MKLDAYHRPSTLTEAWRLFEEAPDARFIAGGTDLMVQMRSGSTRPKTLVSLRNIAELRGIRIADDVRIGALTPVEALLRDDALRDIFPTLQEASKVFASVQIRNAATLGGNLCNASPVADLAPPLMIYDARVVVASPAGEREIPIADFFVGPGETALRGAEVLTEVRIERPGDTTRSRFLKKYRVAMDLALVSVAVALDLDGRRCTRARVAAGAVAPRPIRLHQVEAMLEGHELVADRIARARSCAEAEVSPISDVRSSASYRRTISGVLLQRAVQQLLEEDTP
jgi:carbon-monoxide dehydrogenase medium subunit